MDDDIGVPQALAVVHDHVRAGNAALADGDDDRVAAELHGVRAMVDVLGLDPWAPEWTRSAGGSGRTTEVVDALVRVVLDQRQQARARKDYAAADAIRDGLDAIGVRVEDTPTGARWSIDG